MLGGAWEGQTLNPNGLEGWANFVAIVASAGAAVFWFWASLARLPRFPDVGLDSSSQVFDPVYKALTTVSRRNAVAAAFSAVAALAYAVAFYCHAA
jgi:hypothetical protein